MGGTADRLYGYTVTRGPTGQGYRPGAPLLAQRPQEAPARTAIGDSAGTLRPAFLLKEGDRQAPPAPPIMTPFSAKEEEDHEGDLRHGNPRTRGLDGNGKRCVAPKKGSNQEQDQNVNTSAGIPAYFYGDQLGHCDVTRRGVVMSLQDDSVRTEIRNVIGYDWGTDHEGNSDSLSVRHGRISHPARMLFAATHHALSNDDSDQIREAISIVVDIARADTILDTITVRQAKNIKSRCYEGQGKTSAKCWTHAPQYAAQFAANYLVSAIHLKPHMDEAELQIVDDYARELYRKFIKPWYADYRRGGIGFNQMANGGISELVYAAWSEDRKLAVKTFGRIFKDVRKLFYKDGYINNNSFRGVRGLWYHTYGVNSALAVLGLAEAWKVNVPRQ